jgi:hypothetical protein
MRVLPILAALGLVLATTACAYIERERRPSRAAVQPTQSTPLLAVVQTR